MENEFDPPSIVFADQDDAAADHPESFSLHPSFPPPPPPAGFWTFSGFWTSFDDDDDAGPRALLVVLVLDEFESDLMTFKLVVVFFLPFKVVAFFSTLKSFSFLPFPPLLRRVVKGKTPPPPPPTPKLFIAMNERGGGGPDDDPKIGFGGGSILLLFVFKVVRCLFFPFFLCSFLRLKMK